MSVRAEPWAGPAHGQEGTVQTPAPGNRGPVVPSRAVSHAHIRALVTGTAAPAAGFGCEMLPALPPSMLFPGIVHSLDFTVEKSLRTSSNC